MSQAPARRRRLIAPATLLLAGLAIGAAGYAHEQSAIYLFAVDQKGTPCH